MAKVYRRAGLLRASTLAFLTGGKHYSFGKHYSYRLTQIFA